MMMWNDQDHRLEESFRRAAEELSEAIDLGDLVERALETEPGADRIGSRDQWVLWSRGCGMDADMNRSVQGERG